MILRNKQISFNFDDRTGSLLAIEDVRRRVTYLDQPEHARLFRIFIPDDDAWLSQYCDSHDNVPDDMRLEHDHTLRIRYASLRTPEGKQLDIAVTVTVHLPEQADEAQFSLEIHNRTSLTLHNIRFPWIGGYAVDAAEDRDFAHIGYGQKQTLRRLKTMSGFNLCGNSKRMSTVPRIPSIDVSGARGGIGCNYYSSRQQNMDAVLECQTPGWDGHTAAWAFEARPYIAPGDSYRFEPVGVFVHDGDPVHTWTRYRQFVQSWWVKPELPAHLYRTVGFFNVMIRNFEGRHRHRLGDIPDICREAREIGLSDISIWDMMFAVYLRAGKGDFLEDEGDPGRVEQLREQVLEARKQGMFVNTLVNFRLASDRTRAWKLRYKPWAIKGVYGNRVRESHHLRSHAAKLRSEEYDESGHPLCQNHAPYQRWAVRLAEEVVARTGMNALFIDQPFGSHYCFDQGHAHRPGADDHQGAAQWIAQARAQLKQREEFAYFIGEVPDIYNTQYCEIWWEWTWNQLSPEVIRHVLPGSLQCWIIDAHEHAHEVNRAFSLGFLLSINVRELEGRLAEVPEFGRRIRRLTDLKGRWQDRIPFDKFVGKPGLTAVSELDIEVNAYATDGGHALIVGDCTLNSGGGSVLLRLDPQIYTAAHYECCSEYGETLPIVPELRDGKLEIRLELRPWECVVLIGGEARI